MDASNIEVAEGEAFCRSDRILVEADETILEILGKMDFQSIPSSNIKFEVSTWVMLQNLPNNVSLRPPQRCFDHAVASKLMLRM